MINYLITSKCSLTTVLIHGLAIFWFLRAVLIFSSQTYTRAGRTPEKEKRVTKGLEWLLCEENWKTGLISREK